MKGQSREVAEVGQSEQIANLYASKLRQHNAWIGIVLFSSIVSILGILYFISNFFITKSLSDLEMMRVRQDVRRTLDTIDTKVHGLLVTTCDYAQWDEFYQYMSTGDRNFEINNLLERETNSAHLLDIQLFAAFLPDGRFRYGKQLINRQWPSVPLLPDIPPVIRHVLQQQTPLHPTSQSSGWLKTESGPILIATCAISDSKGTAVPRGLAVMGRQFDRDYIITIEQLVRAKIALINFQDVPLSSDPTVRDLLTTLPNSWEVTVVPDAAIAVLPMAADRIAGYARIDDVAGHPLGLLQVELQRDLYQQGLRASHLLGGVLTVAGVTFSLVGWWLLRQLLHESQRLARAEEALAHETALRQADDRYRQKAVELEITLKELSCEKERSESLLLNILPEPIVQQLKQHQSLIAQHFDEVTILFADIVDFTPLAARLDPIDLVTLLNNIFSEFDQIVEELKLEKIKTIGDAYMVAGGLPLHRLDHAEAIANLALAMQQKIAEFSKKTGESLQIRIGINTGMVVAGVIGTKKFIYDLWGDTVNVASRMESTGMPGKIQVTSITYNHLKEDYEFEVRGTLEVKGKGSMQTYWLNRKKTAVLPPV